MFPIRDHNPSTRRAFVTWALIATNVIVFLSYFPQLSGSPVALMGFFADWALVPAEVASGLETHTLLTSMFLHGGWMHLIMNMLFLFIFGDNLEDLLGHFWYLVFYLAAGVAAGLAQLVADPGSSVPVVGASGAIAGVMGGYLLMFPKARVDILVFLVIFIRIITIPAWIMLGLWFALQLVNGAAAGSAVGGGVAYWAHAGGFVAGLVLLVPVWLRRGGAAFWATTDGRPPHAEAEPTVARGAARDPFAHGPIRSARHERALPASTSPRASLSQIPKVRRQPPESPTEPAPPPGPWSGNR